MPTKDNDHDFTKVSPTASGSVTTTVTQHIKAGKEKEFEEWLRHIGQVAARFPGHQGMMVLAPPSGMPQTYTYIFRFNSYAHLQAWEQSAERDKWVHKLQGTLVSPPKKQVVTGLEYWFQLPGNAKAVPPPRYKMAIVTILAIFPLSLVVPQVMQPYLLFLPPVLRSLCYSVTLVMLMTYAVMPVATRLFSRWLFKRSNKEAQ
jgi:uncharacterized protein